MRKLFAFGFVVVAIVAAGCTRHNPLSCCTTDAECKMFGLDKIYECQSGLVCDPTGACVMPQCQTSADCTSPTDPVCIGQLCTSACTQDADCVGIAGKPYCASDGTCVACLMDSECTSDAPVCDTTARACRGCQQDSECSGGVCLEAYGTCTADAGVLFVTMFGNDSGTCTRAAPCKTIEYALQKVTSARFVVHIDGGMLSIGSSALAISFDVYIDGTNTTIIGGGSNGQQFAITLAAVVLSNVNVSSGSASNNVVSCASGGSLLLYNVHAVGTTTASNGTLTVEKSSPGQVSCTNGTLTVTGNTFVQNGPGSPYGVSSNTCIARVQQNRFQGDIGGLSAGGNFLVENNVFVATYELTDMVNIGGAAPGSAFRFNTIVNTTSLASDGAALNCDSTVEVTSNLFAYQSMHPITGTGCTTKYSLFDTIALASETVGTANKVGDSSTFFVDRASGNYHLAPGSPALKSGESNLPVTVDFDGKPRPATQPDIGAFQAQ